MKVHRHITGIILAGGKSTRMGKEKGLCLLNNKQLVEYSIDTLSQVCNQIIIGANNNDFNHWGISVVPDEIKDIGPIGGIYSCLKYSTTTDNIILSCDMPMITATLIDYIISQKEDFEIVIPVFKNFQEPLCAYYNKSITSKLLESINNKNYKLQSLANHFKTKFLPIDSGSLFYHDLLFANINSPKELIDIEHHILNKQK